MAEEPSVTQFERWKELAARDPEAFEALRRRHIEALIARAPADRRERLRGLQWRIEQARRRAPNPMAACVALSRMMWDSVYGDRGLLATLQGFPATPKNRTRGKVVEFPSDRPR
jgi:hypothetical protein